jgi:hypothetical protein
MNTKLILFCIFFLASCSLVRARYEPGLAVHISEFEKHCKCKITIPIYFLKIKKESTIGLCYGFKQFWLFRYIVLDSEYWDQADTYERESLLFHELGHCVLDKDHNSEMISEYYFLNYRPKSIMHPYSFYQYRLYRDAYIKELFTP